MPPYSEPVEATELAELAPRLRRSAHRLIGPKLRAVVASSDLLQETLLVAVKKYSAVSGRPPRVMLAWLNRIMRFQLLKCLRKHQRELEGTIEIPAMDQQVSTIAPLSRLVLDEVRDELLAAIDELPPPEQAVIVAIYKGRQPIAEIAQQLGKSEGAVRAIHHRAVKRLRIHLEGYSREPA